MCCWSVFFPELRISSADNSKFYPVAQATLNASGYFAADFRRLIEKEKVINNRLLEAYPLPVLREMVIRRREGQYLIPILHDT